MHGADLYGRDLSGAVFDRADLNGADMRKTTMNLTRIHGATLHGAKLQEATINSSDIKGNELYGTDFSYAKLSSEHEFRKSNKYKDTKLEGILIANKGQTYPEYFSEDESRGILAKYMEKIGAIENLNRRDAEYSREKEL